MSFSDVAGGISLALQIWEKGFSRMSRERNASTIDVRPSPSSAFLPVRASNSFHSNREEGGFRAS